ncbi:cell division transport system permease protein [Caldalkalibacillus uzonensis]|uniref:Cell division protein FtsX n=1 Tax=Caldalkalibacillus uzonensis TaxID=353224 RepID=A0ABU0CUB1_9BACI|nr:permease-like cell division protein FtsX [Caldalkalibacillus uzonensis]MDQ0339999.1 cell division transport system permease protein [Caldalkalibacillus uzonensis]
MKIRTLGRHIREGVKNVGRNGWMTVASIISVSITLLVLGTLLILAFNINHMAGNIESEAEIRVLLELEASDEEVQRIEGAIKQIPEVESVTFISGEEALDELIENMGEEGRHFEEFKGENVLPHTFVVRTTNPQDVHQVAADIKGMEAVYKVNDGGETTRTLFSVTQTIRNVGLVFIIGLAFTAMLLIANTIKMTITMRKPEIEIMKLVGATNAFVRWPFFVEGLILGIIGALIPIVILTFGYYQLLERAYQTLKLPFFELLPLVPLIYQIASILLGIGAFIGIWGSMISVRRFLNV